MQWIAKIGLGITVLFHMIATSLFGGQATQPVATVTSEREIASTTEAAPNTQPESLPNDMASKPLWLPLGVVGTSTQYALKNGILYFRNTYLVVVADPNNLLISQDGHYAKDNIHAYYETHDIPKADPSSFFVLDSNTGTSMYSKDATYVYYTTAIVAGANPDSFLLISDGKGNFSGFAKDAKNVYYAGRIFSSADASTFTLVNNKDGVWTGSAKDKKNLYVQAGSGFNVKPIVTAAVSATPTVASTSIISAPVAAATGTSFTDWQWYPLGAHFNETDDYYIPYTLIGGRIYYLLPDRTASIVVADADVSTFKFTFSINEGVSLDLAKDNQHVYYKYALIPGADPKTFVPLLDPNGHLTYFGKDASHAYCGNLLVGDADPASFTPLETKSGSLTFYADDYKNIYYCNQVIAGADSSSFSILPQPSGQFIQVDYSKDNSHVYYQNIVVVGADPASFVVAQTGVSSIYDAQDNAHKYYRGVMVQ